MAQDNPNDARPVEEPLAPARVPDGVTPNEQPVEPRANALVAEPIMSDDDGDTEGSVIDEEENEIPDAESESEDQDEAAGATESASTAKEVATTPQTNARTAKSEEETDGRCDIERQPYDIDHCTVQVAIQLLPDDGDPNGRMVVVGVRSHLDAPILRLVRLNELGALPPLVHELLDALKAELPTREQAAREAFEKKKEEKAKRKSAVTTSKTSRGKKTKAALSTAPASSSTTTTDNRPRPDVQATTAHQQQMGLF